MTTMQTINTDPLVLVLDDEPDWLEEIRHALAGITRNIAGVTSAQEALAFQAEHGPETSNPVRLIVLDVQIPWKEGETINERGGLDLLPCLLLEYELIHSSIPVVVFTAYPDFDECIECIRAGAYYYLPKNESGKTRLPDLTNICARALAGDEPTSSTPSQAWIKQFSAELQLRFNGKYVAVVPTENATPLAVGEGTAVIGGCVVLNGDTFQAVRNQILSDARVRRTRPVIFIVGTDTI